MIKGAFVATRKRVLPCVHLGWWQQWPTEHLPFLNMRIFLTHPGLKFKFSRLSHFLSQARSVSAASCGAFGGGKELRMLSPVSHPFSFRLPYTHRGRGPVTQILRAGQAACDVAADRCEVQAEHDPLHGTQRGRLADVAGALRPLADRLLVVPRGGADGPVVNREAAQARSSAYPLPRVTHC